MAQWAGIAAAASAIAITCVGGVVWRRRSGRFVDVADPDNPGGPDNPGDRRAEPPDANPNPAGNPVTGASLRALGVTPGTPVTLVQFSSKTCAPCQAVRLRCAEIVREMPGVAHLDVDAEDHLQEVRALNIWRTPTVLVVDAHGQIRSRASGAPTRHQLEAAVEQVRGSGGQHTRPHDELRNGSGSQLAV